jgi:hypothetical protein
MSFGLRFLPGSTPQHICYPLWTADHRTMPRTLRNLDHVKRTRDLPPRRLDHPIHHFPSERLVLRRDHERARHVPPRSIRRRAPIHPNALVPMFLGPSIALLVRHIVIEYVPSVLGRHIHNALRHVGLHPGRELGTRGGDCVALGHSVRHDIDDTDESTFEALRFAQALGETSRRLGGRDTGIRVADDDDFFLLVLDEARETLPDALDVAVEVSVCWVGADGGERTADGRVAILGERRHSLLIYLGTKPGARDEHHRGLCCGRHSLA